MKLAIHWGSIWPLMVIGTQIYYLLSVTSDWKVCMAASKLNPTNATFSLKHVFYKTHLPLGDHHTYPTAMLMDHGTCHATRTTQSRFCLHISSSSCPLTLEVWQHGDPSPINGATGSTCPHHPLVQPEKRRPNRSSVTCDWQSYATRDGFWQRTHDGPFEFSGQHDSWIKHVCVSTQDPYDGLCQFSTMMAGQYQAHEAFCSDRMVTTRAQCIKSMQDVSQSFPTIGYCHWLGNFYFLKLLGSLYSSRITV